MEAVVLSTGERLVLAALAAGATRPAEVKRPRPVERDAALARLAAAGLVAVEKKGRAVTLSLTDAGRAVAGAEAPPTHAAFEALVARVARLEALVERLSSPARAAGPLREVVLDAVARLDARAGHGGLVAIPALRDELRHAGVHDDRAVDGVLLALERERAVELRIAQSPATLPDRALGIDRPGRGLVYWVSPRSPA